MTLDKTAMLLSLSVNFLKIAERLTVTVNKARNLLLVDRKGKLGKLFVHLSCIPLKLSVTPILIYCRSLIARDRFMKYLKKTFNRFGEEIRHILVKSR